MDVYKIYDIAELIRNNSYVGRGIIIGKSKNGKYACSSYFIMGRSENSRNRIFAEKDGVLYTKPYDETKVQDPSLIIYAAQKKYKNKLILTNGDHTDTVYNGLCMGKSFKESLESREFEPDAPNFTPRISGIVDFHDNDFSYEMSILKSADENGTVCNRYTFSYMPINGLGHFIHTYIKDGSPLPAFSGEPERIMIPDDIDCFTDSLWDALDHENRISLYVRYTDLFTGEENNRLINKNK